MDTDERDVPAERCVACGSPNVVVWGTSMIHRLIYAACAEHADEGYEHAIAEHQPCNCGIE